MKNCCFTCENLEYRKGYVYPYRCLKYKGERFSEKELDQMCREFWETGGCDDYKDMEER